MTLHHSKYARGGLRTPAPQSAGEVVAARFEHTLTTAQNVAGDIIELGILPANARVVDVVMDIDDLETETTAPTLAIDVGIMSGDVGESLDEDGNARTSGDELLDGDTTGQAGGVVRATLAKAFRVAPTGKDRSIGLKVVTASTAAAEGVIGVTVYYGT